MKFRNIICVFTLVFALALPDQVSATHYPFDEGEEQEMVEAFGKNFQVFRQALGGFFAQGWESIVSCFPGPLQLSAPIQALKHIQNQIAASEDSQQQIVQWFAFAALSIRSVDTQVAVPMRAEAASLALGNSVARFSTLALCKLFIYATTTLEDRCFSNELDPEAIEMRHKLKNILRAVCLTALCFDLFVFQHVLPLGGITDFDVSGPIPALYFITKFCLISECLMRSGLLVGCSAMRLYENLRNVLCAGRTETLELCIADAVENNRLLFSGHFSEGQGAFLEQFYPNLCAVMFVGGQEQEKKWAESQGITCADLPLSLSPFPDKHAIKDIVSLFNYAGDWLVVSDPSDEISPVFARALFLMIVARNEKAKVIKELGLNNERCIEEEFERLRFFIESWYGSRAYNPATLEFGFQNSRPVNRDLSGCTQRTNEAQDEEVKAILDGYENQAVSGCEQREATEPDQNFINNGNQNQGADLELTVPKTEPSEA